MPAAAIICALVPPAGDARRRHHLCSRAAFVTSLLALPPSRLEQCSLSLTREVLPKNVGISISTEMEMKYNNQLEKKNNR